MWAAFILWLCLMPGKDLPSVTIWEADKIGHFGVYIVLSFLMFYGWIKQSTASWFRTNTFFKILLITSCYGFAVEVMQELLTVDRHFDLLDALANAAGAVAGCFISVKLIK